MKAEEFEAKAKFVYTALLPVVQTIDKRIDRIVYEECEGDETVIVIYAGAYRRKMRVDVTGDSLSALARDVIGAIND